MTAIKAQPEKLLQVSVDAELIRRVATYATATGKTRSEVIADLIEKHIPIGQFTDSSHTTKRR